MDDIEKIFAEAVTARLNELETNAFAIEKAGGLPVDAIRSVIRPDEKRAVPRLNRAKQICDLLGLELYVGPPRGSLTTPPAPNEWSFSGTATLPHVGFAKCGIDGWAEVTEVATPLPAPEGLDDPDAFYVTAKGQSMLPEGIRDGWLCLVSPATPIRDGDRVWIRDRQGKQALKRLVRRTETSLVLLGWQPIYNRRQESFTDERFLSGLDRVHPIVAVFRRGDDGFEHVPDPAQYGARGPERVDDLARISLHDVQASAGPGQLARDGRILSEIGFPVPWLARHGISPSHATLIYVDGDSMSPTIENGAMVLVDHNRTTLRRRRVYAFRDGDELYVKRLELAGDQVIVLSDNPEHETRLVAGADLERFVILGEVVWSGRNWG